MLRVKGDFFCSKRTCIILHIIFDFHRHIGAHNRSLSTLRTR